MIVISIQSQVVHGHVGNSAAVYPMQAEGVTVAAVPTTLLSNHLHYPTLRGRMLDAELVADLLRGVEERGLVERASVLVTGYLGTPDTAAVVGDFVTRARARNPDLVYLCDPVVGDDGVGIFVADGLLETFRDRLVPLACVATPNRYELELLSGLAIRDADGLSAAAAVLRGRGCPRLLATGCVLADTPEGEIETVLCGEDGLVRVSTPRLPIRPCGTGDLLTGLFAAHLARGFPTREAQRRAVAGTFAVLRRTQAAGSEELCLTG